MRTGAHVAAIALQSRCSPDAQKNRSRSARYAHRSRPLPLIVLRSLVSTGRYQEMLVPTFVQPSLPRNGFPTRTVPSRREQNVTYRCYLSSCSRWSHPNAPSRPSPRNVTSRDQLHRVSAPYARGAKWFRGGWRYPWHDGSRNARYALLFGEGTLRYWDNNGLPHHRYAPAGSRNRGIGVQK